MQLPDYHDIIEHPMDFSTVRKKLSNGVYNSLEQFEVSFDFVVVKLSLLVYQCKIWFNLLLTPLNIFALWGVKRE